MGYGEGVIVTSRTMAAAWEALEVGWVDMHGCLRTISSRDEFIDMGFRQHLQVDDITFNPHPPRRTNMIGNVERTHGTIKAILERLEHDDTHVSDDVILRRAVVLSNIFPGSHLMSSFEIARGYAPSQLGSVQDEEVLEPTS